MKIEITAQQENFQRDVMDFVLNEINPLVKQMETECKIPDSLISKIASKKYLGATIEQKYGGLDLDPISIALLHEVMGKSYFSVENMLTVFGMVNKAINTSGSEYQKDTWLPRIAAGETVVAFAITEPDVGSDIKEIKTTSRESGTHYILNGEKKWVTLGQIADLFLVFTRCNERGAAFLVEKNTPGLEVVPMPPTLGLRANMLAELHFKDCAVPSVNLVGKIGTGLTRVASLSLDEGRYTTASGSVGLAQACLDASFKYIKKRTQFGAFLKEHNLIQKMIAEMVVNIDAARLLCYQAGYFKSVKDPSSISATLMAKYFASKVANLTAGYAVQIHGAQGCSTEYDVERYYRDAKIMEIIEGTSQMHEIMIASSPLSK